MVMQMKMALPLKKFTGFQRWGVAGWGGVRAVFEEVLLERLGGSFRYAALPSPPLLFLRSPGPPVAVPGRVLLPCCI